MSSVKHIFCQIISDVVFYRIRSNKEQTCWNSAYLFPNIIVGAGSCKYHFKRM